MEMYNTQSPAFSTIQRHKTLNNHKQAAFLRNWTPINSDVVITCTRRQQTNGNFIQTTI